MAAPSLRRILRIVVLAPAAVLWSGCALPEPARLKLVEADREYDAGRYGRAETAASDVIRSHPLVGETAEAYYIRGLCAQRMKRTGAATQDFEQAVKLSKRKDLTAKAHAALGAMAYDDGRWQAAADHFDPAAKTEPPVAPMDEVYYRYGVALKRLNKPAESRQQFARLVQYFPNSVHADEARREVRGVRGYSGVGLADAGGAASPPGGSAGADSGGGGRAAGGARAYAIQCGVFSAASRAESTSKRLSAAGLVPRIEVESRGGRPVHVVYVGMFTQRGEADGMLPTVRRVVSDAVVVGT